MYIFLIVIFIIALIALLIFDHKAVSSGKKKTFYGAIILLGGFIGRFWLGFQIAKQDLLTPRGMEIKAQAESYYWIAYLVIVVGIVLIVLDNKEKIKEKIETSDEKKEK